MLQALLNVFRIAELRQKLLFTIGMLAVYRIGFWIPMPGMNQEEIRRAFAQQINEGGLFGRTAQYMSLFSGGSLGQSTIFGLGIMPYISASIIFQLMASVIPAIKKLQEEGPTGRQKIMEWTRYATLGLCLVQGFAWLKYITQQNWVFAQWSANPLWWVMALTTLTAGTVFLMWLGEQIDKHGIGNGISLIITAGILTGMPSALGWVVNNSVLLDTLPVRLLAGDKTGENFDPALGWAGLLALVGGFVLVVAGSVVLTVAQRRIPVQQAKHTKGRRVIGGQKSYLPLRINHGGVMPVIFASSLMIFPSLLFGGMSESLTGSTGWWAGLSRWLASQFSQGQLPYVVIEVVLIYFFSYFWITVQFNPEEMSKQLRDHGHFIPGLRPGPRTAEYLETVMERVTFVGAGFLAVIAVLPLVVSTSLGVDWMAAQFLGGTGLLIVVSVCLDLVQRIEANLVMRNYAGFLSGDDGGGPRVRSARG